MENWDINRMFDITVEQLLILNELVKNRSCSIKQLERVPYINVRQIHKALQGLIDFEIVEATGRGSGTKYIIHKKHNVSIKDKVQYSQVKKQEKARQKEAILRYLDEIESINNSEARDLLKLPEKDRSIVSKLLSSMVKEDLIYRLPNSLPNDVRYKRKR